MDVLERMQRAENFIHTRDEEGGHEAHEYLKANVAPDDHAEVLRDVMRKTRIAQQVARMQEDVAVRKGNELGCTPAVASYILALEARVSTLEEKVSELRYDVRFVRRAA